MDNMRIAYCVILVMEGDPMLIDSYLSYKIECANQMHETAVRTTDKAGYLMIDSANDYDTEYIIREALQVKLWNSNHRPEHVKPDIMKTLEDLQLDYIDSFVIHWPQAVPSTGQAKCFSTMCFTPRTIRNNN